MIKKRTIWSSEVYETGLLYEWDKGCFDALFGGGGGGGGGTQTSTTVATQELSSEQRELLGLVVPEAKAFQERGIENFPGQKVAQLNPTEIQAQQQLLGPATDASNQVVSNAMEFQKFAQGAALFPETNPALQSNIEGAIRPLFENFQTSVLPSIRSEAVQAGQLGGSRQGIAEGIATRSLANASGDIASTMANQAFQTGSDNALRAQLFSPELAGLPFGAPQVAGQVGAQQRAQEQTNIDEAVAAHTFEQLNEFQVAEAIAQLAFGIGGGTSTATSIGPASTTANNTFGNLLGLGQLGLSAFGAFGGS